MQSQQNHFEWTPARHAVYQKFVDRRGGPRRVTPTSLLQDMGSAIVEAHGFNQRVVGSYLQRDRRGLLRAARLNAVAAAEANAEDTSDPDFTPPATAGPAVGADGDAPPPEDAPRPARASRVRLAVAGSLALVARPLASLAWAAGFVLVATSAEVKPAIEHVAAGTVRVCETIFCEVIAKYESHVDSYTLACAATSKTTEAVAIAAAFLAAFAVAFACSHYNSVAALARCATASCFLALGLVWLLGKIHEERALCARALPSPGGGSDMERHLRALI